MKIFLILFFFVQVSTYAQLKVEKSDAIPVDSNLSIQSTNESLKLNFETIAKNTSISDFIIKESTAKPTESTLSLVAIGALNLKFEEATFLNVESSGNLIYKQSDATPLPGILSLNRVEPKTMLKLEKE